MPNHTHAVWNLPHPRNPFFTGRAQVLDDLHRALTAMGKAALSGMGGVGKTQTAVEYAHLHRSEYKTVLWARADTEDALKASYAAIAAKLNLPEQDETDRDAVIAAVKRWLEGHTGWLLILDNADDFGLVANLLRRDWRGHLLLTTRAHATGGVSKVELLKMPPEEGALFLLRRAKVIGVDDALGAATEADQELAAEITQEVGGLPLALDQAGAFIEEEQRSLAEYLELYRKEGAALRAARGGIIADHEPVTITFALAFQQVASANATAANMLRACAFLAPDAIPEEIFVNGATVLGLGVLSKKTKMYRYVVRVQLTIRKLLRSGRSFGVKPAENLTQMVSGGINLVKMLGDAGRFSLIRRNAKNGTIEIHRVVQQVLKDGMDAEMQRLWAERVVRALNESFPKPEHQNWPLCEKLLPHAQEAAGLIGEYGFEFIEAARLLNQAGYYCDERAQYREAEPLYVQALSICEQALGPEHLGAALSLNNLAALYWSQGKYAEAEPLCVRSLSIREKVFGLVHPDVATSLNNLASLYKDQGKYTEAEPLCVRALSIFEKVLGPEHPNVALSLNSLASLYKYQGKYAEAEPLYVRALSIFEKVLGPEHPNVALSLNSLASLYKDQGKYTEAEPLCVRSLSIREKVFGLVHPDVATSLNNLAALYNDLGKYTEAESLYVRALGICEKALGPEHPNVALSLNNLASLYDSQGKYAEAEPLCVRSLSIREQAFGPEHPDVATSLNNLAHLYWNQDKYAEAEPLYVRALSIFEKTLGPEHPHSLLVRRNYANLLQEMRNETEE